MSSDLPIEYSNILLQIKQRVNQARFQSLRLVNRELIALYWDIGKIVSEKTATGWGTGVVQRLANDLAIEYPEIKGFSPTNLRRMRTLYQVYNENEKHARAVRELPWGVNIEIFSKVKAVHEREFYLNQSINQGWKRATVQKAIKENYFEKHRNLQNNFKNTVDPNRLAELGWEFKDEYNLDLLNLREEHHEKELELAMIKHISKVINEFGQDFAFMGRQYRLEHDGKDYFVDLLFYHRRLKCMIAVELKAKEFEPDHSQQLNWYLHLLDKKVKYEDDKPTIGILLCKSKSKLTVEFALELVNHPIGVATYTYNELPNEIAKYLPTYKQLEEALEFNVLEFEELEDPKED